MPTFQGDIAMIHSYFSFVAAAALVAAPAVASAETSAPTTFTHQGVQYSYTTEVTANERIVRGTAYAGTVPFELHVKKKVVDGTFDNRPVAFTLSEVKSLGIPADGK